MRFGTSAVVRLGAAFCLLLAVAAARAQGSCTFTDENGKTVTWPNCQPPADAKTPAAGAAAGAPGASPAKSFPYPGEKPAASAPSAAGQSGGVPNAPSAPAAKSFPYPGDSSGGGGTAPASGASGAAPAAPANGDGLQDAGSSGSSSSSNAEGSDAGPLGGDDDPAAKAADERRAERRRMANAPRQTPDEREVEDLKVAGFYQNDGNYKGAYDRATDAVSIAEDDAAAHLALADAARRLGKLDEAEKHYKKCLTLDPVPKVQKAAEKALKEMRGGG